MLTVLGLDRLALVERPPQSYPEWCLIAVVVATQHGADCLGGLLGVVEGHGSVHSRQQWTRLLEQDSLREDVVDHVEINDSVEHLATDEAKRPVNGSQCSVEESPPVSFVVVAVRVGVVQVGNGDWYAH